MVLFLLPLLFYCQISQNRNILYRGNKTKKMRKKQFPQAPAGSAPAGSTPKFKKLKQQQEQLPLHLSGIIQQDRQNLTNMGISPEPKGKQKEELIKQIKQNEQQKMKKPQETVHQKSHLKKMISISSENFVLCKITDFQNDYEIVGKIGEGSFGSVYRIRHRVLKLERALKKIKKNPTSQFSSFEQIEILRKLDHRNILKIYQFYSTEEYYMIVTQIFEGRELFDQIVDSEKITEEIAVRVIRQVLLTLKYTHSLGIAHRDIKPENILVKCLDDKDKFKIKIIDWGLGTLIREKFSDRVCGTPQYAAPEVFEGKYSVLCDMWSLGVLTFIILTGNMPFKGSNTQETISQVKRSTINYRRSGFKELSSSAKEFITSLIQKSQDKRMSAEQALDHPWLNQHKDSKHEPKYLKQTLDRLKSFNLGNQFGVAVVNLINNHFSSSEEKDKLEEIFKFLDANGDGVISKHELLDGYGKIYGKIMAQQITEQTFAKLDVNNSGTLEFSQFIAYGLRREKEKEKEKLKQAFDMFDVDKNGLISCQQIGKILQGRLEGLYEQDMKQILSDVNHDPNSEVNFQEFYKFMQTMLEKVEFIRQSKRTQSLIKSQGSKFVSSQQQQENVQLKRTESIDEPVEKAIQEKQEDQRRQKRKGEKSKGKTPERRGKKAKN